MCYPYKTEDFMALNLYTPLNFCKIVFEIVFINIYPIKKEKNAKQSIFNEKYEIVLHTPHSDARWGPRGRGVALQEGNARGGG